MNFKQFSYDFRPFSNWKVELKSYRIHCIKSIAHMYIRYLHTYLCTCTYSLQRDLTFGAQPKKFKKV
jgi:hypothetical protein